MRLEIPERVAGEFVDVGGNVASWLAMMMTEEAREDELTTVKSSESAHGTMRWRGAT
jgi:hypothetical protein